MDDTTSTTASPLRGQPAAREAFVTLRAVLPAGFDGFVGTYPSAMFRPCELRVDGMGPHSPHVEALVNRHHWVVLKDGLVVVFHQHAMLPVGDPVIVRVKNMARSEASLAVSVWGVSPQRGDLGSGTLKGPKT